MNIFPHKQNKLLNNHRESINTIRWLSIFFILIVIVFICISSWFVYTYTYKIIGQAETLILIRSNPHFEPINFKLYNDTVDAWKQKQNQETLDISRDPFYNRVIEMSTPTTSTVDMDHSTADNTIGIQL